MEKSIPKEPEGQTEDVTPPVIEQTGANIDTIRDLSAAAMEAGITLDLPPGARTAYEEEASIGYAGFQSAAGQWPQRT